MVFSMHLIYRTFELKILLKNLYVSTFCFTLANEEIILIFYLAKVAFLDIGQVCRFCIILLKYYI